MSYFVGKRPMNIPGDEKMRRPGEVITPAEAANFVNLRRMLETGEVGCDFLGGEKKPGEMDVVLRSTLVDARTAGERLRERGVVIDEAADVKFIYAAYDVVFLGREVEETATRRAVSLEVLLKAVRPTAAPPKKRTAAGA